MKVIGRSHFRSALVAASFLWLSPCTLPAATRSTCPMSSQAAVCQCSNRCCGKTQSRHGAPCDVRGACAVRAPATVAPTLSLPRPTFSAVFMLPMPDSQPCALRTVNALALFPSRGQPPTDLFSHPSSLSPPALA